MKNVKLLRETLAHIEAEPQKWDQAYWRCETGMCFAGWAATLAGGVWKYGPDHELHASLLIAEPEDDDIARKLGSIPAADRAQRLLGLTWEESDDLFSGDNDLDDLRQIVDRFCGEVTV